MAITFSDFEKEWKLFADRHGEAQRSTLAAVKEFIDGRPCERISDSFFHDAFKQTGILITHTTLPHDDPRSDEEWQGAMFDAVNRRIYQRLAKLRSELGIAGPAGSFEEAYGQRDAILKTPEGRRIASAVMALNDGQVIGKTKSLHHFPRYKDKVEGPIQLRRDMWFGFERRKFKKPHAAEDGGIKGTAAEGAEKESSHVGGLLASYLQWDPEKRRRWTSYLMDAIEWQRSRLVERAKDERMRMNREHLLDDDSDSKHGGKSRKSSRGNPTDERDHREWAARERDSRHDDDATRGPLMGEMMERIEITFRAMSEKHPVHEKILRELWEGTLESIRAGDKYIKVPDALDVVKKLDLRYRGKLISREALRLKKNEAIDLFTETWRNEYPDDPPPNLEVFLLKKNATIRQAIAGTARG